MPTIATPFSNGQIDPSRPLSSGAVCSARMVLDLTTVQVANLDIVEIGLLHPFAYIIDATLVPEGAFGAVTCTVGIMTGTAGDLVAARTVGAELFAAATPLTAPVRNTVPAGFLLAPSETARGIGVLFSALVTAGAGKRLTLIVTYAQA